MDPYGMAVKRLQGLCQDYGAAFEGEVVHVAQGYACVGGWGLKRWGLTGVGMTYVCTQQLPQQGCLQQQYILLCFYAMYTCTCMQSRIHRHTELHLKRCLYQQVFAGEEQPQLVRATCCSQDAIWFEGSRKVAFTLHKQGGNGDEEGGEGSACCRLVVVKQ